MWKRIGLFLIVISCLAIIAEANGISVVTISANTVLRSKFGQLTALTTKTYARYIIFAGNGSIVFNVAGLEFVNVVYQFSAQSFGNGTWTILFQGIQPLQVVGSSPTKVYTSGTETIQYNSAVAEPLIVIYASNIRSEAQTVLFRDDFLYTNPLIESSWTIDTYQSPQANPGEYTSSGYLVMGAKSASPSETVHVTQASFNPNNSFNMTIIKRKMTVTAIPFQKKENSLTAVLNVGLSPLLTTGAYPGSLPSGTPNFDYGGTRCGLSSNPSDNVGIEHMWIDNTGTVIAVACGDGIATTQTIETGLDPTKYTVFTVETAGIYCTAIAFCSDNAVVGNAWAFFRVYQEDANGKILIGTDQNVNITANVAPFSQSSYVFINQYNTNSAASGQVSKIDMVQLQNYGSPVCLVAPAGAVCTRLPNVPNTILGGQGLIGLMAWLSNQLGFGDEQAGAIILFLIISCAGGFMPFFYTRNLTVGIFGELNVIGFFVFAGFLPIWTIILIFIGDAALVVMMVMRFLEGRSMMGAGGIE